ncbi:hypothetical protein EVJ58_g7976 [Rhodofomes roseus]|uniref:Uncharacterized protein n=1 Tax=Rhodofomes roseus TaxID=34475 RepID=A0A4Y9Y0C7_9APHY|nr:hypothetical protein EVJ58_g7976 [Rhodofomes roseus]
MSSPAQSPLPLDLPSEEYAMSLDSDSEGFVSRDNMDVEVQDRCLSGMVLPSLSRIADNLTSAKVSDAEPPEEESMSEEDSMSEDNYTDSDADENNPASRLQPSLGGIPVTDTQNPSPVYYSNPPSSDMRSSNASSPASSKLELSDLKPELLNLEAELSDVEAVPEPLLKRLFGHLLDDPRWPNICGVDKTVEASLNDWIALYLHIQSDPYPYKLFSFTYDPEKHTIHMSSASEIHQVYVQAADEIACETTQAGVVTMAQFEPMVMVNNAYALKGPTPDSDDPRWGTTFAMSVSRKEDEKKKNREATALAREEAKAADKAAKATGESKKGKKSSESAKGKRKRQDAQPDGRATDTEPDDSHAAADHAGSSGASGSKSSAVVPSSPQRSRAKAKSSQPVAPPQQPLNHIPDNAICVSFPSLVIPKLVVALGEIGKSEDATSMTFSMIEYMKADHRDNQYPLIVFVKIEEEKVYGSPKYQDYLRSLRSDEVRLDEKDWAQSWIDIYNKLYNTPDPAITIVCDENLGAPGENWLTPTYRINNHIFMHRHRSWLLCADLNMPEDRLLVEELGALGGVTTADWEMKKIAIPVFASKPGPEHVKLDAYNTFSKRWDVRMQNTTERVFNGCVRAIQKASAADQDQFMSKYQISLDDLIHFATRIEQAEQGEKPPGRPSLDDAMGKMRKMGKFGAPETAQGRFRTFVYDLASKHGLEAPRGKNPRGPLPITGRETLSNVAELGLTRLETEL